MALLQVHMCNWLPAVGIMYLISWKILIYLALAMKNLAKQEVLNSFEIQYKPYMFEPEDCEGWILDVDIKVAWWLPVL